MDDSTDGVVVGVDARAGFAGGLAALQSPSPKEVPTETKAPASRPEAKRPDGPQRLDLYGDPLPEGVLVRMGTARLRHPLAIRLHFAADGKTLISVGQDQTVRFGIRPPAN